MTHAGGGWARVLGAVAATLVGLLVLLIISAAQDDDAGDPVSSGVDLQKIPKLARQMLPVITDVLDRQCPELPPVWVIAEVQAESDWNPRAHSADRNGGASGLYQINAKNWAVAGGRPEEITVPETHLRVGIPWVCANLRAVTGHLRATGKPTDPLDAMLVCHIAGCARVTDSATGVPRAGEAGCSALCAGLIERYIRNVHRYVEQFRTPPVLPPPLPATPPVPVQAAAPVPAVTVPAVTVPAVTVPAVTVPAVTVPAVTVPAVTVPVPAAATVAPAAAPPVAAPQAVPVAATAAGGVVPAVVGRPAGITVTLGGITSALPAAPAPFTGAVTGCRLSDPTSSGCLTATTRYGLESLIAAFGDFHSGPTVRGAGCWDAHAWNPSSDHSKGRACDLFPGPPGRFAQGDALVEGWRVANWYRANADALHVKYLIWQGRYWPAGGKDGADGWGERYNGGGGVYNPRSATGGHYDHVHVSYRD